jgi:hypothetical protein
MSKTTYAIEILDATQGWTDMIGPHNVVTYAYAYVNGTIDLCDEHAEDPPESLPVLGPVSHGEHRGSCHACEEVSS